MAAVADLLLDVKFGAAVGTAFVPGTDGIGVTRLAFWSGRRPGLL